MLWLRSLLRWSLGFLLKRVVVFLNNLKAFGVVLNGRVFGEERMSFLITDTIQRLLLKPFKRQVNFFQVVGSYCVISLISMIERKSYLMSLLKHLLLPIM